MNISAPTWYICYNRGTHTNTSLSPSLQFTTGSLLVLPIPRGLTNALPICTFFHRNPCQPQIIWLTPLFCQIVGVKQHTIAFSDYLSFFFRISYSYFIFKYIFNWRIFALQCCVDFCCMRMQISQVYMYIPNLLSLPPTPPPP